MLHSNRKAVGYRTNPAAGYRIQLSTSLDGLLWKKQTSFAIEKSEEWSNIMNEYCTIAPLDDQGNFLVLYNGNGFGATGFGALKIKIKK